MTAGTREWLQPAIGETEPAFELQRAWSFLRPRAAALSISAIVIASAFFPTAAVRTLQGAEATGVHLQKNAAYALFAPFCNVLDMLALFSIPQHAAFLASLLVLYAISRVVRCGRRVASREIGALLLFVSGTVALYACLFVPRPAAMLVADSSDSVIVDFHSHTSSSGDARRGFTAEQNRTIHRRGGFNVAYITDHATIMGGANAVRMNPELAGEGTVLLSGTEVRYAGQHLNVLGVSSADGAAFPAGNLDAAKFAERLRVRGEDRPVVLLTIPGSAAAMRSIPWLDAVEISDGAPRALAQIDRERSQILSGAAQNHLDAVAGSNDHGWLTAYPAWTVLDIPGWRAMTPAHLDSAIRRTLRDHAPGKVEVVERRVSSTPTVTGLVLTLPIALLQIVRALSWPERFASIAWVWLVALVLAPLAVRRSGLRA